MPLPGGESDKVGNRYEARWTVYCLIDVLDEKADSIRLEVPGEDGFEFYLKRKGNLEYHQVKRQKSGRGRWTLKVLEDSTVQVLSNFWSKLQELDKSCVFVSTQDADELKELANRARSSLSFKEFQQSYLDKTRVKHFATLREKWNNCSELEAYDSLKCIQVHTMGEDLLIDCIENRLSALVEGDPEKLRLDLNELLLEKIHQELTAHNIWHYLEQRGYRRREWSKDSHVLASVEAANQLYLSSLSDNRAIGEQIIPRKEAKIGLHELLESKQSILLVGEAGVGKSGVLIQILEGLKENGVLLLAFRVDRLEPVVSPNNLGQQLGLPASPAVVLANIAQKRECVLLIDQLDAISLASGRSPQFFDCVNHIIKQTQAHPNIRLVLACRKFDLDNDNRLKRLSEKNIIVKEVLINHMAPSDTKEILTTLGLDPIKLSKKQLELLSIPLHLSLLAVITKDKPLNILNFETAKDLYDEFWKCKQYQLRERLGKPIKWTEVIDSLIKYMSSQQQTLSAPENIIDEYYEDAKAMASEHILIWDNKRITFFHESFFDYAFARRFSATGQQLLTFLGDKDQQHLFRRAQIRQILVHEREQDFEKYLEYLNILLNNTNIRFHLKKVVIALLATFVEPRKEEWQILAPLLDDEANPCSDKIWGLFCSSVQWFKLLDRLDLIQLWLKSESDRRVDSTIKFLSLMVDQVPVRVVELVEPYLYFPGDWLKRLSSLFKFHRLHSNYHLFNLFLQLVDLGGFDDFPETDENGFQLAGTEDRQFWSMIYDLPNHEPKWACEAISHYLNRCLNLSQKTSNNNPFDSEKGTIKYNTYQREALSLCSQKSPKEFVEHLLPFMISVMEVTAIQEDDVIISDRVWRYRQYNDVNPIDFEQILLNKMEVSLSYIAKYHVNDFIVIAQKLRGSHLETVQYLLIRAYASNGQAFADDASDYLCELPSRLHTGYAISASNSREASFWASFQLLESITPHCSQDALDRIENAILNYYTKWEMSARGLKHRGYSQLILLNAIDSNRCSSAASQQREEWKRKFISLDMIAPSGNIEPPKPLTVSSVDSPIPDVSTAKMTDEQWLQAIQDYNQDGFYHRAGNTIGGASSLANSLAKQVKTDPKRFAALVSRFPDNTNPNYFDAVLHGLSDIVDIDLNTILNVVRQCHQLTEKPCGRWICWLLQNQSKLLWPQEAFEIVSWYALHDPNPEQTSHNSLKSVGMNSVRGSAVEAIGRFISQDKKNIYYFQETIEQLVKDPSPAVRTCVCEVLNILFYISKDLAIRLFLELCKDQNLLLGTKEVEKFLHVALYTNFDSLRSILQKMIDADEFVRVIQVGARQACFSALCEKEALPLAEQCLVGTVEHRKAASEVFVANFRTAHYREFCEKSLIKLFCDSDKSVRSKASECFHHCTEDELANYIELITNFLQSPAFIDNSHHLIRAFETTTTKLPDLTYDMCDQFVKDLISEHSQGEVSFKRDTEKISQLLIQFYSQNTKNQRLQSKCLDLIDQLAEINAYGLDQACAAYER
jgi:hypothetical protein